MKKISVGDFVVRTIDDPTAENLMVVTYIDPAFMHLDFIEVEKRKRLKHSNGRVFRILAKRHAITPLESFGVSAELSNEKKAGFKLIIKPLQEKICSWIFADEINDIDGVKSKKADIISVYSESFKNILNKEKVPEVVDESKPAAVAVESKGISERTVEAAVLIEKCKRLHRVCGTVVSVDGNSVDSALFLIPSDTKKRVRRLGVQKVFVKNGFLCFGGREQMGKKEDSVVWKMKITA